MDVIDPSKIPQIKAAASFIPAVNIPAYDIGVLDNDLKITFPGSDYAGKSNFLYLGERLFYFLLILFISAYYDGILRLSSGDMLARWSSCCGKPV